MLYRMDNSDHIKIFTNIYEKCIWGTNNNSMYKGSSGDGSDIEYNIKTYIPFLKTFIKQNDIRSIVDLGCGEFRCGPYIYNDLDIKYTGYDAYNKVVQRNTSIYPIVKYNFIHLDIVNNKEEIISGDICILKDVMQHWTTDEINIFLDYLIASKKFKYILLCNCSYQDIDSYHSREGEHLFRPLSANYQPLKKYNPKILYTYESKEISVIT